MDELDLKILYCLRSNARMAASTIAEQVSLSVSAVLERIRKLEKQGVIKQYTVLLDEQKLHVNQIAFISVCLEHPKFNDQFIAAVKKDERLPECHYITGEFDYLLKAVTDSTHSLEAILNSIKSIPGVSLTRTIVVLSTLKQIVSALPDLENLFSTNCTDEKQS